ncbi:hypothetical protein [Sorangium atrum]|uniref:TonB C-terminal domain-containing protein n=1 Tax=Sorangium atrum TaxID=2995308 RepID=A0ABT5BWV1_9BACT|nr:hypothetical protein [Sorangium aterium]MDC0678198.1 hypothetical protein [Sorangium aterium]
MRSAWLVLVGVHALLACGAAPQREPAADADPTHVGVTAPRAVPEGSTREARAALRSPEEKERAALRPSRSTRARDAAPEAPKPRAPIPLSNKASTPARSAGNAPPPARSPVKERAPIPLPGKGSAARSIETDCKALGPEVQKASRMIEVLRQSDLNTPPDVLGRIADRLDLWARAAAVHTSDPELDQGAKDIRESYARTGAATRKLQASLDTHDRKKAGVARAGLERELDQDAKVVRGIAARCKSNPYEPSKGKAHIPPHIVRSVVQERFGEMRACFEKGLRQNPKLQGRLPVHLVVDGEGKVTYAGDADRPPEDAPLLIALPSPGATPPSSPAPPLRDAKVVGCVLDVFRGLRFPSAADRKSVATVVYPVVFGVDDNRSPATSSR